MGYLMDMLAGYPWRTMDKYWRTLLDILYGDLVWRSMGYPRISFGYLIRISFSGNVYERIKEIS